MMNKIKQVIIDIWPILLGGLILRIWLAHYFTYVQDFYTFQFWSRDLVQHGFRSFYDVAICDYLPGYLYILMGVGKVFYWFLNHGKLLDILLVYKMPAILADIVNGGLIFLIAEKLMSKKAAKKTSAIFVFNVALLANSTWWGQVDSVISLFLLLSLYLLLLKRYGLSALTLGLAQVIKPVAILVVPIYILWMSREKIKISKWFWLGLSFTVPIILAFIPFFQGGNFIGFIWNRYRITSGFYPLITLNAFNFWGAVSVATNQAWQKVSDQTMWGPLSLQNWGYVLFGTSYLGVLVSFRKKIGVKTLILANCLNYFLFFMFFTRMHERHVYYALVFLSILVLTFKKTWQKFIGFIPFGVYLLNFYFSYQQSGYNVAHLLPAVYNLAPTLMFISLIYLFTDIIYGDEESGSV
jgi:dolichyl-phosphate-mannose-protein mannosyltransferase